MGHTVTVGPSLNKTVCEVIVFAMHMPPSVLPLNLFAFSSEDIDGEKASCGAISSHSASWWLYFQASTSPSDLLPLQRAPRQRLLGYRLSPFTGSRTFPTHLLGGSQWRSSTIRCTFRIACMMSPSGAAELHRMPHADAPYCYAQGVDVRDVRARMKSGQRAPTLRCPGPLR